MALRVMDEANFAAGDVVAVAHSKDVADAMHEHKMSLSRDGE